jgi:hypothetical protein
LSGAFAARRGGGRQGPLAGVRDSVGCGYAEGERSGSSRRWSRGSRSYTVPYLARLAPLPDARSETRVDVRDDRGSRAESVLLGPATLTLLRTIAFSLARASLGPPLWRPRDSSGRVACGRRWFLSRSLEFGDERVRRRESCEGKLGDRRTPRCSDLPERACDEVDGRRVPLETTGRSDGDGPAPSPACRFKAQVVPPAARGPTGDSAPAT